MDCRPLGSVVPAHARHHRVARLEAVARRARRPVVLAAPRARLLVGGLGETSAVPSSDVPPNPPRLLRMCGICGIASSRGLADPERLGAMSATLLHRGPDSSGELLDGPIGLAARRLSIIDLETGDQPIANEDGTVHVVQNGEIYNYRDPRAELERAGHRFRSHGDTEVLVHLYEEVGDRFAERLRGMFAVAVWDARRARLVLARDRFGIKPLYYRPEGGGLTFASELRALPRGEVDLGALEAFLAFNSIPAPLSIFSGTRKLRP